MKIVVSSFVLMIGMHCFGQQAQSNAKVTIPVEETVVPEIETTEVGVTVSNKKEQPELVLPNVPTIESVDPKAQTSKKKIGG